jgi:hypothetical protein
MVGARLLLAESDIFLILTWALIPSVKLSPVTSFEPSSIQLPLVNKGKGRPRRSRLPVVVER